MRVGGREGARSTTVLWLPFWDGSTTDRSSTASAATVQIGAAGERPSWASGPHGDALSFPTAASGIPRIDYAAGGALDVTGAFSVSAWIRPSDPGTLRPFLSRRNPVGDTKDHAWMLAASGTDVQFTIYDSAQVSATISLTSHGTLLTYAAANLAHDPWIHVRAVFDPSANMYLYVNGQLRAKIATSLANVDGANVGPVQVGGEYSTVQQLQWRGRIADVQIQSAANTLQESCSPSLRPRRWSARRLVTADVDHEEHLQGRTWVNDGAGGFYYAKANIKANTWITGREDIVSVVARTSAGVSTTFTEVGNVTDLDAASNSWFWDAINDRFYSSEDPTTYDVYAVKIRARVATRGLYRGNRHYRPILVSATHERRMNGWGEMYPQGAGGQLVLAAQHADVPDGWVNYEATQIAWPYAEVAVRQVSDGLRWAEAVARFYGFVESQPQDDPAQIAVPILHEPARLFRVPFQSDRADRATYPNVGEKFEGRVFPSMYGRGLQRVRAYCVDSTYITAGAYTVHKWSLGQKIARIIRGGRGTQVFTSPWMVNIDLSAGTIHIPYNVASPTEDIWFDVDGYGTAGTPTSTSNTLVGPGFGSASDTIVTPLLLLQKWLELYAGALTSGTGARTFGSTWTATGARVALWRRFAELLGDEGSVAREVSRHLAETITHCYNKANGVWEWEDVVKADAADRTLRDEDVLSERWPPARTDHLAKRANAEAYQWTLDSAGVPKLGVPTTLALRGSRRFQRDHVWEPLGGLRTGIVNKESVDTWLGIVRTFMETAYPEPVFVLPARGTRVEQMDKLTVSTSGRPTGAASSYRVKRVKDVGDGTVEVECFSETPYPADGTSANAVRPGVDNPMPITQDGTSAGFALATVGAWTRIGDDKQRIVGAGFAAFNPSLSHRFQARAVRTGAGANDLKIRLQDITNAVTLFQVEGFGLADGFATDPDTTPGTLPTADARVEYQYYLVAGAGTYYGAGWELKEGASNAITDPAQWHTIWEDGYGPGATCTVSASYVTVPNMTQYGILQPLNYTPGTRFRFVVYADGTGTTSFVVRLRALAIGTYPTPTIASVSVTGGAAFYASTAIVLPTAEAQAFDMEYTVATASGTVYCAALQVQVPLPQAI